MTKEDKKREIVIPGEVVAEAQDVLPGDWTTRHGESITATRYGVLDSSGKIIKVVPITGAYIPRRGNIVIAEVVDINTKGWVTNISAPYDAFLTLSECPMFVREDEMDEVYDIGDLLIAKINKAGRRSIDLTLKGRGLGKVKGGIITEINPNRVPRVIGKEGSMIKLIKTATNCDITVGQNGLIWIKGEDTENELFAKTAVDFVDENTIVDGLTEKLEEWLKKNKRTVKKQEEKETKEEVEMPEEEYEEGEETNE